MAKMVVVLEWDERKLGKGWMSEGHLRQCLFSETHSKPALIDVTVIATEAEALAFEVSEVVEKPL